MADRLRTMGRTSRLLLGLVGPLLGVGRYLCMALAMFSTIALASTAASAGAPAWLLWPLGITIALTVTVAIGVLMTKWLLNDEVASALRDMAIRGRTEGCASVHGPDADETTTSGNRPI